MMSPHLPLRRLVFASAALAVSAGAGLALAQPAAPPAAAPPAGAPRPAPAAPAPGGPSATKPAPAAPAPGGATAAKPAPAGTTATWWGHAAWVITTPGGATIAIDPWLDNPKAPKIERPRALDAILVSHAHSDHVGNAGELAKQTGAKLIASFELATLIGAANAEAMNIGGTITVKDATIHLVEAVHSSGFGQDKAGPKYGGSPMGFVIEIQKGPVIYHSGDTEVFAGMSLIAERYRPTVGLLPIGGYYTMDPAAAALASRLLKLKTVVPMHFGTFPALKGTPDELRAAVKTARSPAKVLELQIGEPQALK